MGGTIDEAVILALRALFLVGLPVVVVLSLAGTLASVLQAATSISEPVINYGVRLAALIVTLYFLFPIAHDSLLKLAELAFQ